MSAVLRPLVIYFGFLLFMRLTGKRSLGQVTTFDFVLLLIISETIQAALMAKDQSLTGAAIAVGTLVMVDVGLSLLKHRWRWLDRLLEDEAVVLLADGVLNHERMNKERVDMADILEAARTAHGIERLDQIKLAVLERHGAISIIPSRR
jgi:uncharacterized membrane protein YcaP (DUF421 family)